jgi:hypothetical protein
LFGECLAGALYIGDFLSLARKIGFRDPRQVSIVPVEVTDPALNELCGNAKFYSIEYRLFKIGDLDDRCEDYGQIAKYNGGIPGSANGYALDEEHVFEHGRPSLVCGNTAMMLQRTWLSKYFTILGDMSFHFGLFPCGRAPPPSINNSASSCEISSGCCS